MGHVILVTGGARSGKSALAERLALTLPAPRTYIATCPLYDDAELHERVRRHQRRRQGMGWMTVEEEIDVAAALRRAPAAVILVDCVTLWVNNLLHRAEAGSDPFSEDDMAAEAGRLVAAARAAPAVSILVTSEVGQGVVPDNAPARAYRDLIGRANQMLAAAADVVVLTVCGLPLVLKGASHPLAALAVDESVATGGHPSTNAGEEP